MNRVAFHVTTRRVLRGEIYTGFYTEEGGARKLLAKKKKKCYFGLRPLLLVVEGKGRANILPSRLPLFPLLGQITSLVLARKFPTAG